MEVSELDQQILEDLYAWVDQVPLSRPKKDIKRDFSDGVLVAEVCKFFMPRFIELHNYAPANKTDAKITNWNLLNRKAFRRLGFEIGDDVIRNISSCKPWALEQVLMLLRRKIDRYLYEHQLRDTARIEAPEAEQTYQGISPRQKNSRMKGSDFSLNTQASGGSTVSIGKPRSQQNLHKQTTAALALTSKYRGDMVPKLKVEEKEQEILIKEETIQILQAKVRRLEHLLHLKDIRIDDLQGRMERLESRLRPTAHIRI